MNGKKIYMAGPLFSAHERHYLEELVQRLSQELRLNPNKDFFLPHRDAGDLGILGKGRDDIFQLDIDSVERCSIVIALLDGPDIDSGTAVELGYAYARNKQIYGILTDLRRWDGSELKAINNMVWGVCDRGRRIHRTVESLIAELRRSLQEKH